MHKYLYANANPVMYSDPSGCFGIVDITISNGIAANLAFYGVSSGLINLGINLIDQLRSIGPYDKLDVGLAAFSFFEGALIGMFFYSFGQLAQVYCNLELFKYAAAIYTTMGFACVSSFINSCISAQDEWEKGSKLLSCVYYVFAAISLVGGWKNFEAAASNAMVVSTANSVVENITDPSAYNDSKPSSNNNLNSSGKEKPYSKSRPPYANNQVEQFWENAKDLNGRFFDPNTGEELFWDKTKPRNGQWDMGHIKGEKYSVMREKYMSGEITKEQFWEWYRDPSNYQPESPHNNRSHKYE